MELKIILNNPNATDEIVGLRDLIREQNLKGVITNIPEKEPQQGTMGLGDLMPVLQLILGSTAVAAGIKGLFDLVKNYYEMRKQIIISNSEIEKKKLDQYNIDCVVETNDGKKVVLKFNSFNNEERKQFFQLIDTALEQ